MLKKLTVLALMILVAVVAGKHHPRRFHENHYKSQFIQWMNERNILYSSRDFHKRYDNFKNNVDYIANWNEAGSSTILGLTDFADLSNREYRQTYLGTTFDASDLLEQDSGLNQIFVGDLPNHLDWRVKGAVSHVKDQGRCGSCWSFSTVGALEGSNFLSTGKMETLSEQQLVDCTREYGNYGCNGGLMEPSFQYIIDNGGIMSEEAYPYTATDKAQCKFDKSKVVATMSAFNATVRGSEESLLQAVQHTPIAVAIDAGQRSFQLYKAGVYFDQGCSSYRLSHAVLLVGYGEDTTTTEHSQYWIVKNSWGTKWGNQGYIFMAKDASNHCGIASMSSYAII
ncbi:hypothetical protein CYY_001931 [Polysphondylium violaceum]|uniref:Uncharacterized protein n=1 Tax=Polysphondylium violaceum TaxID=133409 RepID=A0A8J4V7D8_9MYCE|nr:hypothetical protein CYY_001931 [Polysphondylium violaceum]